MIDFSFLFIAYFDLEYRTKEQLGYVVQCGSRMTYRIFGFCFSVQSSKYNPVYLQDRIDYFIDGLKEFLVLLAFSLALLLCLCVDYIGQII